MFLRIIKGGWFVGKRTYILSAAGIISAIASYLVGDENLFNMLNTVFLLGGIYFLRKSKGEKNGNDECAKKISK